MKKTERKERGKAARNGREEMRRANGILEQYAPGVPPVESPGRAAFVTALFDLGQRGHDLDWRGYEDRWVELADGSSSSPYDTFVVHANEKECCVHYFHLQKLAYSEFGETPAAPAAKSYATGYKEIFKAVGVPYSIEQSRSLKRLCHKRGDSPIQFPGIGKKPIVEIPKLVTWWNLLTDVEARRTEEEVNTRATIENEFAYGRGSRKVLPDIGGHIKKRAN
ncbi:MAG: hypothetical protein WCT04_21200 [Planctomycetota bacterium]